MAFTRQNWSRASVGCNEPIVTVTLEYVTPTTRVDGCFREYNYFSPDTQAVIGVASYFDGVNYEIATSDYVSVYSTTEGTRVTYRLTNTDGVITAGIANGRVQASVAITAAQFNGMYAASVELLPAPGAANMYILEYANIAYTDDTQYANGGDVAIQYSDTAAGAGEIISTVLTAASVIAYTADSNITLAPLSATLEVAPVTVLNEGLYLGNITGAYDTGTGTWLVNIIASVITIA